jgi:uncharacterized membrane protein YcaP (DUF421 family)
MKPEEIKLGDWGRILAGNVPPEFYLELIIRVFFIYLLLMVSMRLLGKRMSSSVSRLEMATMVALASAIGVPMLSADRGLLPAVIIAGVTILIHRLVVVISFKSEHFERVSQGSLLPLVQDGTMVYNHMRKARVTRERLFAQMRSANIMQLGAVKRFYLEPNGTFALVKDEHPQPGLTVLPDLDPDYISRKLKRTDKLICFNCGMPAPPEVKNEHSHEECKNCKDKTWTYAVVNAKDN